MFSRHCLDFKDDAVIESTLSAWECFIEWYESNYWHFHCNTVFYTVPCSVETESLGPLLGQIVVALSPFVEKYPAKVSSIFEFFIIKNR